MTTKEIISEIPSRDAFFHLLNNNPGLIILKFGAEWCGPCKLIKPVVDAFFAQSPVDVVCGEIDVDQSFDVYSMLKSKKMTNGIPVILCYKRGNQTFAPDDIVTGANATQLDGFFKRCSHKHLMDVRKRFPPIGGTRK